MVLFAPFHAVRPDPATAAAVVELPYDVMSRSEAAEMVIGRPDSLLHVTRPEIDLTDDCDFDDPRAYQQAAAAYKSLRERGVLRADPVASYYAYRITRGRHQQTGVVGAASVVAYEDGRIRRHELTRPAKQADRAAHITATGAQTGPVFLVHRPQPDVAAILADVTAAPPEVVVERSGDTHELWPISQAVSVSRLLAAFDQMPILYIADGHHRSAAAAAVAGQAGERAGNFLAVSFPADEVAILPYNRLVRVPGRDPVELLAQIGQVLDLQPAPAPVAPYEQGQFGIYAAGQWWLATAPAGLADPADPVASLDVSILQDHILGPVLGIGDPRTDANITFVGGVRGVGELRRAVDSGAAEIAFSLCATGIEQLLQVADAGALMPPKSTWFEPKLLDGMTIHEIGEPVLSPPAETVEASTP